MARLPRPKSASNIYHVVIRGADRQNYFEESKDYTKYLDLLAYYKEKCNFKIYAYCLMSNHVHLLIYTPDTPLEDIFRRLNTHYATWFNMKYDRTGFLQQGRYYCEPVEDYNYLINVIWYIHNNPVKAGLEPTPGSNYHWSSVRDYVSDEPSITDTFDILNYYGGKNNFLSCLNMISSAKCIDVDNVRRRIPDDVARSIIQEETGCSTANSFQKLDMLKKEKYLIQLHEKGISIRQLNRLTGISKGVIERTIVQSNDKKK